MERFRSGGQLETRQIYQKRRKCLHNNTVQLPPDWLEFQYGWHSKVDRYKLTTFFLCYTAEGYYIYIETSLPRRRDHKARLVSPTLAAVQSNNTCVVCKAVNSILLKLYCHSYFHMRIT